MIRSRVADFYVDLDGPNSGSPPAVSALVFDLDGTLVDTMPIHYEAYRRVLDEVGIELMESHFMACVGGTAPETIPRFLAGRPCALSVEEIHRRKVALTTELLVEIRPKPLELAKLLGLFRGRFKLALVSSGSRESVRCVLDAMGWSDLFSIVVTGSDVDRGKPAPDPFLLAASLLGVASSSCLVFEDTDAGVEAGEAAGMRVFDVRRVVARSAVR